MDRKPFYDLIRRQSDQWLAIDKGKVKDDSDEKVKPLRPKKVKKDNIKVKGRNFL